jgi:cytoskeletal protein RodZ
MNDDELVNHLRTHDDHLDDAHSGTIGRTLNKARARASAAPVRRRNPALIGAVVTLVIVTIAGGVVWRYVGRTSTIHVSKAVRETDSSSSQAPATTGDTSQADVTTVSPPDTSTATIVAQPLPAVTSRIEVPDTIVAGTRADAALVVDNNTGADITIPGCGPLWAITLTNASHPAAVAFTLPCLPSLVIGVGQTRFPTMLMASLSSCTDGPSLDDTMAKCVDGGPPPVPPGEYSAVLVGLEKDPLPGIPNPAPVPIHVVAAP